MTQGQLINPGEMGRRGGNPLDLLAEVTVAQTQVLAEIRDSIRVRTKHIYAVHPVDAPDVDGVEVQGWLTYCLGCSEVMEQFIFPCRLPGAPTPALMSQFAVPLNPPDPSPISLVPETPEP